MTTAKSFLLSSRQQQSREVIITFLTGSNTSEKERKFGGFEGKVSVPDDFEGLWISQHKFPYFPYLCDPFLGPIQL